MEKMLEKLEGKILILLIILLVLVLSGIGLFVWGHHTGSVNQSNADSKHVMTCDNQNAALAQAIKTDAATIRGLKEANAATAAAAEVNETQLKASVTDLSNKLAQLRSGFDKKHQALKETRNDSNSAKVGNAVLPADILSVLQH